jgi:hypothetical protein
MSQKFSEAAVFLALAITCLALLFAGCAQAPAKGGEQASARSSVVPSVAPSTEATAPAVSGEPSLSAAQQRGGSENENGDFVFDLPDASDAKGSDFDSGLDSFD